MNYSNPLRKTKLIWILFFTLLLFAVSFFWAFLSVSGINFNFKGLLNNTSDEELFIQTGGLRVITDQFVPTKLTAYIDGNEISLTKDRIENIQPGEHILKLEVDEGYNAWEGTVEIFPQIITDISPLFLPTNLELEPKFTKTNIDKTFYSKNGDYVYYVVSKSQKGTENGIFKAFLTDNTSFFNTTDTEGSKTKILNIVPQIEEAINDGNYTLKISSDNRLVVFDSPITEQYLINVENPVISPTEESLISIEQLLGHRPEEFQLFKNSGSIIFKHNNLLGELILSNQKIIVISYTPEVAPIYGVNGDTVIFYSPQNNILYSYKDETKTEIKLENTKLPENISQILVSKDSSNFVIFKSENSYYYLNIANSFLTEIGSDIKPIEFAENGSALLYETSDNKVNVFKIKEDKIENEFEIHTYQIFDTFNFETDTIKWNARSTHLIVKQKVDDVNYKIMIVDERGENRSEIITSDKLIDNNYYMLSDNKEFIILLNDSLATEDAPAKNNLYSVDLSVKEN